MSLPINIYGTLGTKCLDVMHTNCNDRIYRWDHPPLLHLLLYTIFPPTRRNIPPPNQVIVLSDQMIGHKKKRRLLDGSKQISTININIYKSLILCFHPFSSSSLVTNTGNKKPLQKLYTNCIYEFCTNCFLVVKK